MKLFLTNKLSGTKTVIPFFLLLLFSFANHTLQAQELHTVEGDSRVEQRLNIGTQAFIDNISVRGFGGNGSSTGLSITHNQSFNLGPSNITKYAEGRLWNNGTSINLGHGLSGSGGTLLCLLYTSPSPRDATLSRMPSSA